MQIVRSHRFVRLALLGSALALPAVPAFSADPAQPSVAEMEQQIAALQDQLKQKRIAEAQAAVAAAAEAARRAEEGRTYLASIGQSTEPAPASTVDDTVESDASDGAETGTVTTTTTKPDGTKVVEQRPLLSEDEDGKTKFGGIEFGIGIAYTRDIGETDRIGDADEVAGLVRVKDDENSSARLLLETHYFFTPVRDPFGIAALLGIRNYPNTVDEHGNIKERGVKNWGWGPFFAVQPGEGDIIQAIGGGLMLGLRRPGDGSGSFNIGLGVLFDMNVRTLGDGVVEGEPLPTGETVIRFKEQTQTAFMLMSSYSF